MEALSSSETSVFTRAARRNIPEHAILQNCRMFSAFTMSVLTHPPKHYSFHSNSKSSGTSHEALRYVTHLQPLSALLLAGSVSRGSAVFIPTANGLDDWEVLGSRYRPDRLWDPRNLITSGYRGLFPRGLKAGRMFYWPLISATCRGGRTGTYTPATPIGHSWRHARLSWAQDHLLPLTLAGSDTRSEESPLEWTL
jgi:hypothetical protein